MKNKFLLFSVFLFLIFPCLLTNKVFAAEQIDINNATLQQLDELTGIGPVYAQRIIDGRPYSSVDDLLRVTGIGPKTLENIKEQGLAYVAGQSQTPTPTLALTPTPTETPTPTLEITPTPTTTKTPTPTPIITPRSTATPTITPKITAIPRSPSATGTPAAGLGAPKASPTPANYASGIIINEILPSPEGPDTTDEWIELYNQNNFDISLAGWKIKDTIGTTTTFTFSSTAKISANGFLVLERPDSQISLNNDADGLNLLQPNGNVEDKMSYEKAPKGQSYNLATAGWHWSSTLTPGKTNIVLASAGTKTAKSSDPSNLPAENDNSDSKTASIASKLPGVPNSWKIALIGVGLAVVSAGLILALKKSLSKKDGSAEE